MRYSRYIFFLFCFLCFCNRNFYFSSVFVLEFSFSFSSAELLFPPVLSGDYFSGDVGAFITDFFLPGITWVHPSSHLLLGWSPVSVLCVFVVAGVEAGIVAFEVGVVFVVIIVVTVLDADYSVAVLHYEDVISVVLLLLVVC